ncbi:hypothetical protein TrVE_jg5716 [Triparma verrucosa]|uniref:folate gamma-glutamyl hydrolase n=1 Tax=Triparma verrucosa TaxID=1606542 RepID=A0A9W7CD14_9STRA|nr:hypothetical protein TrVE_jg5716 [Triparma verrucosa]
MAAPSPVMGIMSHPLNSTHEFIAASYVKWLGMGGARAVRIPFTSNSTELDLLRKNLNGVLFMGGGQHLPDSAQYLYEEITTNFDLEDATTLTPLWGICLGFQWLLQCASEDTHILKSGFDAENISLPLDFTDAGEQSRMYTLNGAIDMVSLLKDNAVTLNNHGSGVKPEDFTASSKLDEFDLLSTNEDRQGLEFVSSFEHSKFPIYGTQYHPEKSNFEYGSTDPLKNDVPYENISHSIEAVRYSFELATLLVSEAAKTGVKFDPAASGLRTIIEQNDGVLLRTSFEESYVFKV